MSDVEMSPAVVTEARTQLAAAFRWFHKLNYHEGIANHFSYVADPSDSSKYLVNPFGRDFSTITASDLVLVDQNRPDLWMVTHEECRAKKSKTDFPPIEPTAFCIHGELHRILGPRARCILHLHPQYATAFSSLLNPHLPAIDQNTARFHKRLSFDQDFGGMGVGDEATRLAKSLGPKNSSLILGNHGCLVVGESVGVCIDRMFYLETSCRNYMTAVSTGKELKVLSDEAAETTATQWEDLEEMYGEATMIEVMRVLDRDGADYRK